MSEAPVVPGEAFASASEVHDAVARVASSAHLAVALDFDGVLAPLGDDPMGVTMAPGAAEALTALAALPATTLALVSGRRLVDLVTLASPPVGTLLAASHGAEHGHVEDSGVVTDPLDADAAESDLLERLDEALTAIAGDTPGVWVERKTFARVLHTRTAEAPEAAAATDRAVEGPASWDGVHAIVGKSVVELAVRSVTKADGVAWVRESVAARAGVEASEVAVVFAGDDTTDENALLSLGVDDLGVKVGHGETAATLRIADEPAVVDLVRALIAARA
ncbi:trehalose-phosphatase [Serinibacter arcticus]|uniref:Trehalose 6-phosphate phosphatase n=1 Tax=Serinibacter arcticus TaxID=1655435 RepID=A0A2U1ZUB7_9MICO|nr:trehalose-phosphatase [Serinibacter arcticus]PWD50587.1 trehalose-phosphatase [Serinibacter arcticus]